MIDVDVTLGWPDIPRSSSHIVYLAMFPFHSLALLSSLSFFFIFLFLFWFFGFFFLDVAGNWKRGEKPRFLSLSLSLSLFFWNKKNIFEKKKPVPPVETHVRPFRILLGQLRAASGSAPFPLFPPTHPPSHPHPFPPHPPSPSSSSSSAAASHLLVRPQRFRIILFHVWKLGNNSVKKKTVTARSNKATPASGGGQPRSEKKRK